MQQDLSERRMTKFM